jgi:hypothetical protein
MSDTTAVGFNGLADESGGLLEIYVLGVGELRSLVEAALNGDTRASRLIRVATVPIESVETAPTHRLVPCGACLHPIRRHSHFKVGIALPDCDAPHRAMAFALCEHCCRTDAAADRAAIAAVRDVFPTAVVVTHPAGGTA